MVNTNAARGGTISNVRSTIDGREAKQVVSKSSNTTTYREVDTKTGEVLRERSITNTGKGNKIISSSRKSSSNTPSILKPYSTEGISDKLNLRPQETQLKVYKEPTYDINYRGETTKYQTTPNPRSDSLNQTINRNSIEGVNNRLGLTPNVQAEIKPNRIRNTITNVSNRINNVDKRVSNYLFEDGRISPKPFREGERFYFDLPKQRSVRLAEQKSTRTSSPTYRITQKDGLGIASGIRKEITNKPVSTALTYGTIAGVGTGLSYGKLGFVKVAGKVPALQKTYGFISRAEKVADVGLSGAYLGLTGLNVATSKNKGEAVGREFVKFSSVVGGINTASRLSFKANYLTNFEKNFQKIEGKYVGANEFLKSKIKTEGLKYETNLKGYSKNIYGYTLINNKGSPYKIGVRSTLSKKDKLLTLRHELAHAYTNPRFLETNKFLSEKIPYSIRPNEIASRLTEYKSSFYLKNPKGKIYRDEFNLLKSELPGVSKGSIKPTKIPFSEVEALQKFPKSQDIVKSFLKANKNDVVVGGSLSSRTQISPNRRFNLRAAGDIDVYTDKPGLAKDLNAQLKANQIPSYFRGNKVYIKGVGKAVEFQGLSENGRSILKAKQSLEGNFRTIANPFRSVSSSYKFTPEGIAVTKIQIQAARKLYGGFEFSQDKLGRVSSYRYSKDIPDYKALVQSTKVSSSKSNSLSMFASKKAQFGFNLSSNVSTKIIPNTSIKPSSYRSSYYSISPKNNYYSLGYNKPSNFKYNYVYNSPNNYKPLEYKPLEYKPIPKVVKSSYSSSKYSSISYPSFSTSKYSSSVYSSIKPFRSNAYPGVNRKSFSFDKGFSLAVKGKPSKKELKLSKGKIKNVSFYVPSLEANLFNIKSKKVNLGLAKTGLTLRPILK